MPLLHRRSSSFLVPDCNNDCHIHRETPLDTGPLIHLRKCTKCGTAAGTSPMELKTIKHCNVAVMWDSPDFRRSVRLAIAATSVDPWSGLSQLKARSSATAFILRDVPLRWKIFLTANSRGFRPRSLCNSLQEFPPKHSSRCRLMILKQFYTENEFPA